MTSVKGKIPDKMFSDDEIHRQKEKLGIITTAAAKYLDETYADHLAFYKKNGVSRYYGNRRPEYATKLLLAEALKKSGKPPELANQMVGTACILLAMQSLEKGFKVAEMEATWRKIHDILKINNEFLGTDLQMMLRQLGWKIYYWNPDPSKNAEWDAEDRKLSPAPQGKWKSVWGGHTDRYVSATKKGLYSGKAVDNAKTLVGFGKTPPAAFGKVPFFIGTAHDGYHVFPGCKGEIIEAHSMRNLTSADNLERSKFNPLAPGGGPRWTETEKYRSGLIAVPTDF